jgi:hypothetical protein
VVTYDSASRRGEPFEAYIAKYGIPNQTNPACTTRLKENVLDSYRKSIGWMMGKKLNFQTAIGIRSDEIDRMSTRADELGFVYPLVEKGITKAKVNAIMAEVPWDLKLPNDALGNCVWCWKKSDRKLFTLAKTESWAFDFPARMEEKYGSFKSDAKASGPDGRRHFFRGHRDTSDIFRQAKEMQSMILYTDQTQMSIFDALLDTGGSCDQGCEVFHG